MVEIPIISSDLMMAKWVKSIDYGVIEQRILAWMCGPTAEMVAAQREEILDEVVKRVVGKTRVELTEDEWRKLKPKIFLQLYGGRTITGRLSSNQRGEPW